MDFRTNSPDFGSRFCKISSKAKQSTSALAMNIAHYQSKYGELPLDETLAMLGMDKPNEEQLQLITNAMEIFVGVLGSVVSGVDQPKH
jgi:hypothetical protein